MSKKFSLEFFLPNKGEAHLISVPSKNPSYVLRAINFLLAKSPLKRLSHMSPNVLTLRKYWEKVSTLLPVSSSVICTPFTLGSLQAEWQRKPIKALSFIFMAGPIAWGPLTRTALF